MRASFQKYTLQFKQPSGTSRGIYTTRDSWFVFITDGINSGIGECAPLPDLSIEPLKKMSSKLYQVCDQINYFSSNTHELNNWPSIKFGIETALLDMRNGGNKELFPSAFTRGEQGISINGLIWMGSPEFMKQQIKAKLDAGFHCIKMKIGALGFETEFEILKSIRKEFSPDEITLRVDANCAYSYKTALENLKRLADLHIHSIEQPIETNQWEELADLCLKSPVPIALDEELIGINTQKEKQRLLETVKPAFLILKPSLHGGFSGCEKWIELAEGNNCGWWVTSALESNIGLNAIAQWAFHIQAKNEQGLGTGQLFTNNFESPLEVVGEHLWFRPEKTWNLDNLQPEADENDF